MKQQSREEKEAEVLFWFLRNMAGKAATAVLDLRGKTVKPGKESHGLWAKNLEALRERVDAGWTLEEIAEKLLQSRDRGEASMWVSEMIPRRKPDGDAWEERNLVDPNAHYAHRELRPFTPPVYDEEGRKLSGGHASRKERYTGKELLDYYWKRLKPPTSTSRKDVALRLKYFLEQGSPLDEVLVAIDIWAVEDSSDSRGYNTWELRDFLFTARKEKESRMRAAGNGSRERSGSAA